MEIFLIDGTYELFRHYFAVPEATNEKGQEIAAVRGVLNSLLPMLEKGATHIAVATDHVVESFRNDLYQGYKTSAGVPEELLSQFPILEDALKALGILVWPMIEFEADDALAAAAAKAALDRAVDRVFICTPDKDLSQSVVGTRIVQMDRRRDVVYDEAGVIEKFGVLPESIPDYLALVGDTADGYPGLAGWGAKGASSVLSKYLHFEEIPLDVELWPSSIRSAKKLAATLFNNLEEALLYRKLATLRLDVPVFDSIDEMRYGGPTEDFAEVCQVIKATALLARAKKLKF